MTARHQVAEFRCGRRERDEQLIVSAADAIGSRSAALDEARAADQMGSTTIHDLQTMGFRLDAVAQVLDVVVEQLADRPTAGPA